MNRRRDIGTDDPRVRVRPGKGSRPRTKRRPDYSQAPIGWVRAVDRGRFSVVLEGREIKAVKARELGRHGVVLGDRVRLVGDLSGNRDTLARIVTVEERATLLMRSPEDGDVKAKEKPMVANADRLVIVCAVADPTPRAGMIDRCLVAAYTAGMEPLLCLTKLDLASPADILARYRGLGLDIVEVQALSDGDGGIADLRERLAGEVSVLIGHSGVGKSTVLNALIPGARRETGHVNAVTGKGRHTTTAALAFPLSPDGDFETGAGWVIDTPGVRGFGLAHIEPADVIAAFPDTAAVIDDCPRACPHTATGAPECELDQWAGGDPIRQARVDTLRRLMESIQAATNSWE